MKKMIVSIVLLAGIMTLQAATFTDDFDRSGTVFTNDISATIGAGYVLAQVEGDRLATARILFNQIQFSADTSSGTNNPGDITMYYENLELKNAASNESFRVEGDILTHSVAAPSVLYGLAFNIQPDGSFYAARINTGNTNNVLQFVYTDSTGNNTGFGNIPNSVLLETNAIYHLKIESFEPGIFEYTLTGPGLDGDGLIGTVSEGTQLLEDGYAGFYATAPTTSIRFDNLELEQTTAEVSLFEDDYDIEGTATVFSNDASVAVGPGYELFQISGDKEAQVRILFDQIQLNQGAGSANAGNVVLHYTPFELTNAGSNESFIVEGDINTKDNVAGTTLYGLAFNVQSNGDYYCARINTGNAGNALQFVRFNSSGAAGAFHQASNSVPLAVDSDYHLKIECSEPGVFNYRLTGPDLDGGGLFGTATDAAWALENGTAGFYASATATDIRFDNLSLRSSTVSEILSGFDTWSGTWGVNIGAATNDYDGDLVSNFAEYAFGGNPTNALDSGVAPELETDGSGLVYVFPQRSDDATLAYSVETTDDLVSGVWTNAGTTVIDTNVTGNTLDYVTNSVSTTDPQLFIRLEVQQN